MHPTFLFTVLAALAGVLWEPEASRAPVPGPRGGRVIAYTLDPAKSVVRWVGRNVVGRTHTGTLKIANGSLSLADGALAAASFVVDMRTLDVDGGGEPKLVTHLKNEDFFDVARYPSAAFVFKSARPMPPGSPEGGPGKAMVEGELTIKGITHPVRFPAAVTTHSKRITATAALVIDRAKWEIKYGSGSFFSDLGDDMIRDEVELHIEVVAKEARQPQSAP